MEELRTVQEVSLAGGDIALKRDSKLILVGWNRKKRRCTIQPLLCNRSMRSGLFDGATVSVRAFESPARFVIQGSTFQLLVLTF